MMCIQTEQEHKEMVKMETVEMIFLCVLAVPILVISAGLAVCIYFGIVEELRKGKK